MSSVKWRALKIGTGTFMAQAVTFLFLPVIARIYVPEEYGKLSIFLSLAFILIPIGTLKIDTILVVIKNQYEADTLLVIAMCSSAITSFIACPFTFMYFYYFEELTLSNASFQSFLFSALLFLQCLMVLSVQVVLRMRKDNLIVASSFGQNFSISVLQVVFGKAQPTGDFLVIGFILGKALGIIPMYKILKHTITNVKLSISNVISTLKNHAKTGSFLLLASFFDAASISLPAVAIGILFGLNYSGILGITQSVLTVPITLVGGAIGSVLISEIAKAKRDNIGEIEKSDSPLNQLSKPLLFAGAIFTLTTFFLGPKIFEYLLGVTWSDASNLVSWLAIPFGINFFWQPLSNLLFVESNWKMYLKFSILRLTLSCLVGFSTLFFGFSWIQVASGFAFGGSFAQLIGIYWIWKNFIKGRLVS